MIFRPRCPVASAITNAVLKWRCSLSAALCPYAVAKAVIALLNASAAGLPVIGGQLKLLVPPSEMTKISLKRHFRTFEIRPSIETVALGKGGFMSMQ
jgi:hypothetical protein